MKTKSIITFEKRHIEEQEFKILLEAFNPQKMSPEGLALGTGSLRVTFGGYADTTISPIRVPELRTFLQALLKEWGLPAAVHFCDLHSAFFTLLLLSQINPLCVVEFDQKNEMVAVCRRTELEPFAMEAVQALWAIGRRARLKSNAIKRREKQLLNEIFTTFRLLPENSNNEPTDYATKK